MAGHAVGWPWGRFLPAAVGHTFHFVPLAAGPLTSCSLATLTCSLSPLPSRSYEWNKYNQTHYDGDNPPPKTVQVGADSGTCGCTVGRAAGGFLQAAARSRLQTEHCTSSFLVFRQGYKFNIFYPELIDKTVAPTYKVDKDPTSDDGEFPRRASHLDSGFGCGAQQGTRTIGGTGTGHTATALALNTSSCSHAACRWPQPAEWVACSTPLVSRPSPPAGSTCILRFSAGPPYEDIAFRILNKEW